MPLTPVHPREKPLKQPHRKALPPRESPIRKSRVDKNRKRPASPVECDADQPQQHTSKDHTQHSPSTSKDIDPADDDGGDDDEFKAIAGAYRVDVAKARRVGETGQAAESTR